MSDARYVTDGEPKQRLALYRLCPCDCTAEGRPGKAADGTRCPDCRGEGRQREKLWQGTSEDECGREIMRHALDGAFVDCPLGLLDREADPKWRILPWPQTARTLSAAGRTLAGARRGKE